MGRPPTMLEEAVRKAGQGAVRHAAPAGAGERNDVWLVEADGGPVVVRFLAAYGRLSMEAAALDRARRAGVPVAEVLWSAIDPHPVMVQRRMPGVRLADVAEPTDALCESAASVLRTIHALGVEEGFGNLDGDLRGQCATLGGWFIDLVLAEVEPLLADEGTSREEAALLEASIDVLADARSFLDACTPAFAHGDFHAYNLLADGDRITGVLDWEAAKSGPPALDFGWWDWFSAVFGNPWPTDVLLDRYDPDRTLDRDEMGLLRRLVVRRVWTRELIAGLRNRDRARARAARLGLTSG